MQDNQSIAAEAPQVTITRRRRTLTYSGSCEVTLTDLSCGHCGDWRMERLPIGSSVPCAACAQDAADLERLPALVAGSLYSRVAMGGIHFYEPGTGPTGVRLLGSVLDTPANMKALEKLAPFNGPLSPTEGRAA